MSANSVLPPLDGIARADSSEYLAGIGLNELSECHSRLPRPNSRRRSSRANDLVVLVEVGDVAHVGARAGPPARAMCAPWPARAGRGSAERELLVVVDLLVVEDQHGVRSMPAWTAATSCVDSGPREVEARHFAGEEVPLNGIDGWMSIVMADSLARTAATARSTISGSRCRPAIGIWRWGRSGRRQLVALELLAQLGLQDLAGAPCGISSTNDDVVGHPPFGDLAVEEFEQLLLGRRRRRARTTISSGRSSHFGCGTPMTAASATAGWPMAAFSSSIELIHSPPDLMTSLRRSMICT